MIRVLPGTNVASAVAREIAAIDPRVAPYNARSMDEQTDRFMIPLRTAAWTYGVIGVFGLVLACVGVAGVTALGVAQRRHEIGVRMAVGATGRRVLALVMKQGVVLIAAGTVAGLAAGWAGIRLMSGFFFSVASIRMPAAELLAGAPILLAAVALFACYLPARRTLRLNPVSALRHE
jgi:putative ABC transport system permease protein